MNGLSVFDGSNLVCRTSRLNLVYNQIEFTGTSCEVLRAFPLASRVEIATSVFIRAKKKKVAD
jgi:hypothetical protein